MTTTTLTKTAGTSLLTHQAVTHPDTVKGSATDVATKIGATVFLFHSAVGSTGTNTTAEANTNPGIFRIEGSASASGDEDWVPLYQVVATVSTADVEAMTATEPSGETVLACASTTGFVAGDVLYIQDTGTVGDSEWARCQEVVSNTSINLVDGLTNGKDSSDIIWNDADIWAIYIDLSAITRVRVVFQHEGAAGANCHVKAMMVTLDSATS
jgi:hypothetical protein